MKTNLIQPIFFIGIMPLLIWGSCRSSGAIDTERKNCNSYVDSILKIRIYTEVDVMPLYRDGEIKMLQAFSQNYHVPQNEAFQGAFKFEIIINESGEIIDLRIKNKKRENYSASEKNALKAMKNLSNWVPAMCNNIPVPIKFPLVIRI